MFDNLSCFETSVCTLFDLDFLQDVLNSCSLRCVVLVRNLVFYVSANVVVYLSTSSRNIMMPKNVISSGRK